MSEGTVQGDSPGETTAWRGTMNRAVADLARSIGFWTRVCGGSGITFGTLTMVWAVLIGSSAAATSSTSIRREVFGVALLYFVGGALNMVMGLLLWRYGEKMQLAGKQQRVAPLREAFGYENTYWRIAATLVILSLIGGFLSMSIPAVRVAVFRSQGIRTIQSLRAIGGGLEEYAQKKHEYPNAKSIDDLARLLEPKYVKSMPRRDGWDRPFEYAAICGHDGRCPHYRLYSRKESGTDDQQPPKAAPAVALSTDPRVLGDYVYGDGELLATPRKMEEKP